MIKRTLYTIVIAVIALSISLSATVVYVPDDYPTIQSAVNAADNGGIDEIVVRDGTYNESIHIDSYPYYYWLHSENGPENCIIQPINQSHCMIINDGVKIEGFTFANASHTALLNYGSTRILNCVFKENGMYQDDASAIWSGPYLRELSNCVFTQNDGKYTLVFFHDIEYVETEISIKNNLFYGNSVYDAEQNTRADICINFNTYYSQISIDFINNTIDDVGAIYVENLHDTTLNIKNSIFVCSNAITDNISNPNDIVITFSDFTDNDYEGVYGGGFGNLVFTDPKLCWTEPYEGYLLETSPCIDAGDFNTTDSDGTRVDMGCYPSVTDIKKLEPNHISWVSFPRLNRNENDYVVANYALDNFVEWPFDLDLYYLNDYPVFTYISNSNTWNPPTYAIRSSNGYKINPKLNTAWYAHLPLTGSRLPEDYQITYTIEPNQYEWLGYWLPKTQNITDAFGVFWQNVEKVKAEDWYYDRQSIISKDGGLSNASSSTKDKNMEYGKSYMVWFKDNSVANFHWTNSGPFKKSVKKEKPEHFTYTDKPDYEVIDVISIPQDVSEIGVFKDGECIGAVVVKDTCEQILIYPGNSQRDESPLDFEIISERGKASPIKNYLVYNYKTNKFENDILISGKQEHSIIKFVDINDNNDVPENIRTELFANYPNPFNPITTIRYTMAKEEQAKLEIFNIKGQLVKTLVNGKVQKGNNSIVWHGDNNNGKRVASGIYLYKLSTKEKSITKKMIMLK